MKQPSIVVRSENKADQERVFEINKLAFKRDHEARLVDRLRTSRVFIPELSLVADHEGKTVGHILFTKIRINSPGKNVAYAIALAPMAVLPDFQHQGIGGMLIRKGLEIATAIGHKAVVVLGHEHYYPRFGFVPADKWGIKAPYDVPAKNFMALELFPGALDNVLGIVEFAPEFDME